MDSLFEFVGRFHPVLVHLPIGILLVSAIFIWIGALVPIHVIRITLAIGTAAAVASVVTGLLLARSGDYDPDAVFFHQWLGILTTIVGGLLWYASRNLRIATSMLRWMSGAMVVLLTLTGHLGGNLTHGSGYLTAPIFRSSTAEGESIDLAAINIDSAQFYSDVVAPILEARCYSCHGSTKQKGGMRLDNPDVILKGGKNGKAIVAGNPEESELIKRIELPIDHEDHMPPKEKKQLTESETKLISLWILNGADFKKKMRQMADRKTISEIIGKTSERKSELPDVNVGPPDANTIYQLTSSGVSISKVSATSNFVQVNFVTVPDEVSSMLPELKPLAKNIVILKMPDATVDDESFKTVGEFSNLINLVASRTKITDASIAVILECKLLQSLNLEGTKVTELGIEKLVALKDLRYLNLYNTRISKEGQEKIKALLPNVEVEFGGYVVPTLPLDTVVVKL